MPKTAGQKPRRTRFDIKSPKKNPNSLRRLLRMIREDFHRMTQAELAQHLNNFGNVYTGKQTEFTEQTVKNLETDRSAATYVHLERYAWSVGLPTGLLLVYSRLMSKQHNDLLREITMLKAAVKDISNRISRRTIFNDKAELLRWSAIYRKHERQYGTR